MTPARSASAFRLLCAALLAAAAGFASFGVWQVHRLTWKRDLIARIDARIHAAPVAAPGPAAWDSITASHDAYRRVRVKGEFLNGRETYVQAVTAVGAGYWVMTPLRTDDGFMVLINRGFVPPDRRDLTSRAGSRIGTRTLVVGLLRITEPRGGFLRRNDPADDRWYSRDVAAIAEARHLTNFAPYFIDAEATPGVRDGPVGGLTVVDLPNNHLAYALTWFAMMALAIGSAAVLIVDEAARRRRPAAGSHQIAAHMAQHAQEPTWAAATMVGGDRPGPVFPADAGMNRASQCCPQAGAGVPRRRGDEPCAETARAARAAC